MNQDILNKLPPDARKEFINVALKLSEKVSKTLNIKRLTVLNLLGFWIPNAEEFKIKCIKKSVHI